MKKIDTHGLEMIGLAEAARSTENYGPYSGCYNQVLYNRSTGEVWTRFHESPGRNAWTAYDDPAIILIGNATRHYTQQAIADAIANAVVQISEYDRIIERPIS